MNKKEHEMLTEVQSILSTLEELLMLALDAVDLTVDELNFHVSKPQSMRDVRESLGIDVDACDEAYAEYCKNKLH